MFVNRFQSSGTLNYCSRDPLWTVNLLSQAMSPPCGVHMYCNNDFIKSHRSKSDPGLMINYVHLDKLLLHICLTMSTAYSVDYRHCDFLYSWMQAELPY